MRVTFVLNHANLTGGVRVIGIYAERLRQRGHEVVLVSRPRPVPTVKQRAKALLRGDGWLADPNQFPTHLDALPLEHWVIDEIRPITDRDVPDADVVIATWWETAPWVDALLPQKGAKVYFVQDFGANDGQPMDKLAPTWRLPMHKIVISSYIEKLVRQHVPADEELSYVPNSVDLELFSSPVRGKQPTPTVGTIYSKTPFKGADICFNAVEIARGTIPDLRLIGFGHQSRSREMPLPENAGFRSRVPDNELKQIYGSCDAWLFAPRKEGFGLPILEAMACRTPVIATPAGAAPELVSQGGGILVEHEDCEAMAQAIVRVCSMSDNEWRPMSEAAFATASRYSWDDATDLFEAALRKAVERTAGRPALKAG